MEEPQKKETLNFQIQLQNLSELQARIQETRKSLNQLVKIQGNETRNLQSVYKMSLLTTRNKLNLWENHKLSQKKHELEAEDIRTKQQRVKEMKQREQRQLRQIRNLMKQNKQNQRTIIRNNSLQYDETIKKNRKLQLQKKGQVVKEIKQEKQLFKKTIMESRLHENKMKEVELFNKTLARIQRQPSLTKELERLIKQKEEVELRVHQRKEMKQKMREQVQKLKKMKESQVVKSLNRSRIDLKLDPSNKKLLPLYIGVNERELLKVIQSQRESSNQRSSHQVLNAGM